MQYNKGEESMKEDFRHEEKEFASYVTGSSGRSQVVNSQITASITAKKTLTENG